MSVIVAKPVFSATIVIMSRGVLVVAMSAMMYRFVLIAKLAIAAINTSDD